MSRHSTDQTHPSRHNPSYQPYQDTTHLLGLPAAAKDLLLLLGLDNVHNLLFALLNVSVDGLGRAAA